MDHRAEIRLCVYNAVRAELQALHVWVSGELAFNDKARQALRLRIKKRLQWYEKLGYAKVSDAT